MVRAASRQAEPALLRNGGRVVAVSDGSGASGDAAGWPWDGRFAGAVFPGESDPAIALRRVISSSESSTSGGYQFPDVAVVEMDADRAAMLAATAAV